MSDRLVFWGCSLAIVIGFLLMMHGCLAPSDDFGRLGGWHGKMAGGKQIRAERDVNGR